ncbi:MAG: hypothetical protein IJ194_00965 [Bacilli bacterium]|nr:hypothetical protein [Bacilli bacterium]
MKDFVYVSREEALIYRKKVMNLIKVVQKKLKNSFSFTTRFVGSSARNMVSYDQNSNVGPDLDVNICLNNPDDYEPKYIKEKFISAFNQHSSTFGFDYAEDSTRVITLKTKDRDHSRILFSCDIAIVAKMGLDFDCFIYHNKKQDTYEWQLQREQSEDIDNMVDWIKDNGLWELVREKYIDNKNNNRCNTKKSIHIFNETIHQVYNEYQEKYY